MKASQFLLLLTFLLSLSSFSQDLFDELNKKDKELYLKRLKQYKNDRSYTYAEKEALKVQREDILKSKVILVAIKKGSLLVRIDTNDTFLSSKEIIARAFQKEDYEGYRYLIGKGGKIRYKVNSTLTSNMKTMLSMYEEPRNFKEVTKKIDYNLTDSKFNFNYDLSVNLGLAQSDFLNDITNSKEHTSTYQSYDFTVMGRWNFPIKSGLALQYESQSAKVSNINYTLSSVLLGAVFEVENFDLYIKSINAKLKLYTELTSDLKISGGGTSTVDISKNVLQFSLDKKYFEAFSGDILIGLNLQRQWLKAKANNKLYTVSANTNNNDIFFLSFTYRGHGQW